MTSSPSRIARRSFLTAAACSSRIHAGQSDAPLPLAEIRVRDPFILPHNGTYYLYAQMGNRSGNEKALGVEVYRSSDLATWQGPHAVFEVPPGFWAQDKVWAPEVHFYKGRFYLLATFTAQQALGERDGHPIARRGTQVLWSKSPMGPFRPFANAAHTPSDWSALDGTLWIENGTPYLVFCHEWTQIEDGTINLLRLTKDLSAPDSRPKMLFHASDGPWVQRLESNAGSGFVTDGPFLHRTSTGTLLMIWSSFGPERYAIGVAESKWGSVEGPWVQHAEPFFRADGGHGMLFRTFDGKLKLVFHQPNRAPLERARIFDVRENGDSIELAT